MKSKWSVSDFIRAFIKFHGHVYLSKSLDKLDGLREKLEEQFQVQHRDNALFLPLFTVWDDVKVCVSVSVCAEAPLTESLQLSAAGPHHCHQPV